MLKDVFISGQSKRIALRILALTALQQALVAASTVLLAAAARQVAQGGVSSAALLYGGLYLAALTLPYFPGVLAIHFVSSWRTAALERFIQRFLSAHRARPELWRNPEEEEKRISAISREAGDLINDTASTAQDSLSLLLNLVLSSVAIILVLDNYFFTALSVSVVVAYVFLKRSARTNSELSSEMQARLREHNRTLLRSWDNVVLGNDLHYRKWRDRETAGFAGYQSAVRSLSWFQQTTNLTVAMALFLPVLAAVAFYASQHRDSVADISALLVTLPRLFAILNFAHALLTLCLLAGGLKARWSSLAEALAATASPLPAPNGKLKIVSPAGDERFLDEGLLRSLLEQSGRFRVLGENGAGKSTALLKLKELAGEKAIYLPAASDLDLERLGPFSTGQRKRAEIAEIIASHRGPLLLDEWDGPLDFATKAQISEALDHYSRTNLVVEVSHRE